MDPHRIHRDLYESDHTLTDPGNGGTIRVTGDLMICEMVSVAAETRTLAAPTKSGIRFVLRLMTDGGDIVVTIANGLDSAGETIATFNDASDMLSMISAETTTAGTFRWERDDGNTGVTIAA
jgi:hypothetical protein